MTFLRSTKRIFARPEIASSLLAILFFLLLNLTPGIPGGDDGYRHLKMAQLIATDWQEAKAHSWHLVYLWPKPVDVWFGFELFLSPLTKIFSGIVALKIYISIIFGGILYTFQKLLRALNLKQVWLWTGLLLLGSNEFLVHATLSRPQTLALLLLLLAVLSCQKNKLGWLLVVSALFAFSYSVFFLVLIIPIVYLIVRRDKKSLLLLLLSILGVAVGVVLNPYFPQNLYFSLVQAFAPVLLRLQANLNIGIELAPLSPLALGQNAAIFSLWGLALYLFFSRRFTNSQNTSASKIFFLFSTIFCLLAVLMQKFLDHFEIFALLFAGLLFEPLFQRIDWAPLRRELRTQKLLTFSKIFLTASALVVYVNFSDLIFILYQQTGLNFYRPVSEYLLSHAPPNAVIMNLQWDAYPQLFFWNSKNYYLTGLDPTFFYLADKNRYWLWRHMAYDELITCAAVQCALDAPRLQTSLVALRTALPADYILFDNTHNPKLLQTAKTAPGFKLVFADTNVSLLKVVHP